jgi:hypothetical protein
MAHLRNRPLINGIDFVLTVGHKVHSNNIRWKKCSLLILAEVEISDSPPIVGGSRKG